MYALYTTLENRGTNKLTHSICLWITHTSSTRNSPHIYISHLHLVFYKETVFRIDNKKHVILTFNFIFSLRPINWYTRYNNNIIIYICTNWSEVQI